MLKLGMALILGLAAASSAAVPPGVTTAARAEQVTVQFAAQFSQDTPKTKFSAPGARFRVAFQVPRTIPQNANMFDVTYTLGSVQRTVPVYFNVSDNPGQPQGFTLSLNDESSGSAINIVFFADDFFVKNGKRRVDLLTGRALLRDGYTVSTSFGGAARYPLVNPSVLRIRPLP